MLPNLNQLKRMRLQLLLQQRTSTTRTLVLQKSRVCSLRGTLETTSSRRRFFMSMEVFRYSISLTADPHVGHMHSMVVADVIKRYKELQGKAAILSTGTDEHGMKVQKAAFAAGTDPLEFCTASAQKFKDLAQQMNMSEHVFIRTTQPEHKAAVQHFWVIFRSPASTLTYRNAF